MSELQSVNDLQPVPIKFTAEWIGKGRWRKGFSDVPTFGSAGNTRDMVTFRILGDQFSGKSALLAAIATYYLKNHSTVYDIFGANDNEMLTWLDSPYKEMVTLIHGNDIELRTNIDNISIGDLHPARTPEGRIYISSRDFFRKRDDDFFFYEALFRLTVRFRERRQFMRPDGTTRTDFIMIREADEFLESQKHGQVKSQSDTEAMFAKFHNQMVHYGFALGIDQHRDVDVAKKIRYLANYLIFKNMGNIEIPRPWWPLRGLDPDTLLRKLSPRQFAVVTNKQKVGVGVNDLPSWHIQRGEDVLRRHPIIVIDKLTGREAKSEERGMASGVKGKPIPEEVKEKILELAGKGWTQSAIAAEMRVSQPAVHYLLKERREQ